MHLAPKVTHLFRAEFTKIHRNKINHAKREKNAAKSLKRPIGHWTLNKREFKREPIQILPFIEFQWRIFDESEFLCRMQRVCEMSSFSVFDSAPSTACDFTAFSPSDPSSNNCYTLN